MVIKFEIKIQPEADPGRVVILDEPPFCNAATAGELKEMLEDVPDQTPVAYIADLT